MTELRTVAIVGAGKAGLQHARAAKAAGLSVVAHASRSASSDRSRAFSSEFPESKHYSIDNLAICDGADLTILAVPPDVAHRVSADFIRRSQKLLIEKPVALTTLRVRELLAVEQESNCHVVVGYNRRSYPLVRRIQDLLIEDHPTNVEVVIVEDIDYLRNTKREYLHSSYLRHGSAAHFLDLVQFLFGSVLINEIKVSRSRSVIEFVDFFFRAVTHSGIPITVSIDAGDRGRRGLNILTTYNRQLHLSPLETLSITSIASMASSDSKSLQDPEICPTSYCDSFEVQLRNLANGATGSLHRLSDSLRLSILIDELERASEILSQ